MLGSRLRLLVAGSLGVPGLALLQVASAPTADAAPTTTTFGYASAFQTYTVPAGVTQLSVRAQGGNGGAGGVTSGEVDGGDPGRAGRGGAVSALVPVTPGETLRLSVGGGGASADNPPCEAGATHGGHAIGGRAPDSVLDVAGGQGGNADECFVGAGGAGGAATVVSRELGATLLVAGGGGGGGGAGSFLASNDGGRGGNGIGQAGTPSTGAGDAGSAGAGGTVDGSGGAGEDNETFIEAGAGGGGGGGYPRSGGGGGTGDNTAGGGGGGGGQSYYAPELEGVAVGLADANLASANGSVSISYDPNQVSLVFDSSPNPSLIGAPVTFTTTAVAPHEECRAGTVTVRDDASNVIDQQATTATDPTVSFQTSLLPGSYTYTATYLPASAGCGQPAAQTLTHVVGLIPSQVELAASPTPAVLGLPVDLTATVTSAYGICRLGRVEFYDGTTLLGSRTITSATEPTTAVLTHSFTDEGTHPLTATFHPSSEGETCSGDTSEGLDLPAAKSQTFTTVTSNANPIEERDPLVITARVSTPVGSCRIGSAVFKDGTTTLGTVPVPVASKGVATLTTSALAAGPHPITVAFTPSGTEFCLGSSGSLFQVVGPFSNVAPELDGTWSPATATEDQAYSDVVPSDLFFDPDGDPLTYAVTGAGGGALPGWLSYDASTRTLSGTPLDEDAGTVSLRVTASDPWGESASTTVELTVEPVNDPPVVSKIEFLPAAPTGADTVVLDVTTADEENEATHVFATWAFDQIIDGKLVTCLVAFNGDFDPNTGQSVPVALDLSKTYDVTGTQPGCPATVKARAGTILRVQVTAFNSLVGPPKQNAVEVVDAAPTFTATPAVQSAQFTDPIQPVVVTADDPDGDTYDLVSTDLPAGLSAAKTGTNQWTVTGTTSAVGTLIGKLGFGPPGGPAVYEKGFTITGTREDAELSYTGDQLVPTGSPLVLKAEFRESAAVGYSGPRPETGGSPRAIGTGQEQVRFDLYPSATCGQGSPTASLTGFVTEGAVTGDGIGDVQVMVPSFVVLPSATCVIATLTASSRFTGASSTPVDLLFYSDTGQFAVGSGAISVDGAQSRFTASGSYDKKGKPTGSVSFTYPSVRNGVPVNVTVSSTSVSGLAFSASTTAVLEGKANVRIVRRSNGAVLETVNGAPFLARLVDGGKNGDRFGLSVWRDAKRQQSLTSIVDSPVTAGSVIVKGGKK